MNILHADIETAPDKVWVWGVYEQNAIAVAEHWYILSMAWKWAGEKQIHCKGLIDYPSYNPKMPFAAERKLLDEIVGLLDRADLVVAHNGDAFDLKKINTRLIVHGLTPPSPYKTLDTKKEVKRVAKFSSNKLDWLCKQLEIGRKLEHEGWPMWAGCMEGDRAAWAKMKKYNRHDITLLEELYKKLGPWLRKPNALLYGGTCTNPDCPGPGRIQFRGTNRTKTRSYSRFQCQDCGVWSQAVHADPERVERKPV